MDTTTHRWATSRWRPTLNISPVSWTPWTARQSWWVTAWAAFPSAGPAELRPDQVAVLVYLTAVLIPDGATFMGTVSGDSDLQRALEERSSWDLAADRSHVIYKMDQTQHRFYNDCSPEDVAWAQSMVVPQPVGPLLSPMRVTDANFGCLPRVYIECAQDNAVASEFARAMYTALPCVEIIKMATGHSPFLSAPDELAQHLQELARYAVAGQRA